MKIIYRRTGAAGRALEFDKADTHKMSHRTSSCIALLLALAGHVANAQIPTPSASGIEGVIMVSPSRPGPIRDDDPVPSAMPVANVRFVVKKEDAQVASFITNAEGQFRVSLPPGHYTVLREGPGARIGHWRFQVEVVSGEIAKVTWTGDSGMR